MSRVDYLSHSATSNLCVLFIFVKYELKEMEPVRVYNCKKKYFLNYISDI